MTAGIELSRVMDVRRLRYTERPLVKSKIIATAGPACAETDVLREMILAGADLFRFNFAHGSHQWLGDVLETIRAVSNELATPVGILGDLAGPKIRLGEIPGDQIECGMDERFRFVRKANEGDSRQLTSTYEGFIDDLKVGDHILLADGTVRMRVLETERDAVEAVVEVPGTIRGKQGVHVPGVQLRTPLLSDKDRADLAWAVENGLDFVGLSFVRSPSEVRELRTSLEVLRPAVCPQIIAKIETTQAVDNLDGILDEADAVMVARGDLGVEADIAQLPVLQKRIIRRCNQCRLPVITATQMLDSMQRAELPTRAEASDVANAVLDGSDALMLSGETAIGAHPVKAVAMMSRIAQQAEQFIVRKPNSASESLLRTRALDVTEAVAWGAGQAAEELKADLIVVATHSGKTAMAVSKQRNPIPILALSDRQETTRRMCLYWGVTPLYTKAVELTAVDFLQFVVHWGRDHQILKSGSKLVLVFSTDWSAKGHDMMLVHQVL